jgi:hypothetical protein
MSSKPDDLEAVRLLADTLQPFPSEDRERIIRWAREKLGMVSTALTATRSVPTLEPAERPVRPAETAGDGTDIKSFVTQKAPKSDVHFAATVAYYHQFMAPAGQRKDSITKEDLVEACRQVPRKRPKRPAQVLVNAYQDGVLDRGRTGHYKLNSVGENLVAMALPGTAETGKSPKKKVAKGRRKGSGKKKGARKGR